MKFYKKANQSYTLKENKLWSLLGCLIFIAFAVYFWLNRPETSETPFWLFCLPPMLIFLYKAIRKVEFDALQRTLKISLLNISIKERNLSDFRTLLLVNHKAYYFFNNGREIKAVFNKKEGLEEIQLIKKQNFKKDKIEAFIKETNEIINIITKKQTNIN